MGGEGVRTIKPDELERLAGLLDKVDGATGDVFSRAGSLQVSALLTPLRELPQWATGSARDLRRRAAIARLQTGDPFAGLAWAGFSPLEIAANGDKLDPGTLVYVNSVSEWATAHGKTEYARKPGESLDDYLKRLESAALAKAIPALEPHQETVAEILKVTGDITKATTVAPIVTAQGVSLGRLLLHNNVLRPLSLQGSGKALSMNNPLSRWANNKLGGNPVGLKARSATAPGTYLSQLTRKLFMRSSLYRDFAKWIPEYMEMDQTGKAVGAGRALMGLRVNRLIDLTFGNNELARKIGGLTHSGQPVRISGEANLLRVWAATADRTKMEAAAKVLKVEPGSISRMGAVARTAGALRMAGIAGGAASTVYSAANVISQGDPRDAFKRNGAGYVADVAEMGFNASLTAAMVCPNPFTIGATVTCGAVYLGAKVVEHWDDISAGAKKAAEAVGSGLKKAGGFIKSLNPFD